MGRNELRARGRHLDAVLGNRLGRCRPRRPCRRAPRARAGWRSASAAPITAWTSPLGDPDARQPVRGARMPGCHRRQLRRRAGHAAGRRRRARACWPSSVLGMAAAAPFDADKAFPGGDQRLALCAARPRHGSTRVIDFAPPAGYALQSYERYARIRKRADGLWRRSRTRRWRSSTGSNIGTIIEAPMLNVRMTSRKNGILSGRGGPPLGKVEESISSNTPAAG